MTSKLSTTKHLLLAAFTSALALAAAPACSGDVSSDGGGGSTTSSSSSSSSGAACSPKLPTPTVGCPDTPTAEAAFAGMQAACTLAQSDFDATNPQNPTLTAAGKAKLCSTCDCEQKTFDYYALYASCTAADPNAALAKNAYTVALACP